MKPSYQFTEDKIKQSFKYRIKKNFLLSTDKYEKVIYTLLLISLYVYAMNSQYPLIYSNRILDILFITKPSIYSPLIENISLSIIGSSIFYIITEIIPYKRRKIEYSDEIELRIFGIYSSLKRILYVILKDEKLGMKLLEENRIQECELLLKNWEDITSFLPPNFVFEEVEKVVTEIREEIDKLLVFENFLDYEIREIIYNIPRCCLFSKTPYSKIRGIVVSNIRLCDIYDIYEKIKDIERYAKKSKKVPEIFSLNLYLNNKIEEYEKYTKNNYLKNSRFAGLHNLSVLFLKNNKMSKAKKYLIMEIRSKAFYLRPEEMKAGNFFQFECENPKLLKDKEYLELRSEIMGIPKESKSIKELLNREYVKNFRNWREEEKNEN